MYAGNDVLKLVILVLIQYHSTFEETCLIVHMQSWFYLIKNMKTHDVMRSLQASVTNTHLNEIAVNISVI